MPYHLNLLARSFDNAIYWKRASTYLTCPVIKTSQYAGVVKCMQCRLKKQILTVTGAVFDASGVGILRIKPGEEPRLSVPCLCHGTLPLEQKHRT